MQQFKDALDDCGLMDLGYRGPKFGLEGTAKKRAYLKDLIMGLQTRRG